MRFVFFTILLLPFLGFSNVRYVRVMFNSNASNSATIAWHQESGETPVLMLSTNPDGLNQEVNKHTIDRFEHAKSMDNQFVRLSDLQSDQRYYFQIIDSEGSSRIFYFSTVTNQPSTRLSFIAGGDSRDLSEVRRKANQLVAKLKPHAVLFNGDFTGQDTPKQWIEWFDDWEHSVDEDGRITPLVVTRGNHEITNKSIYNLFDVPNKRVYYNVTFGGTLLNIVSLNSEILKIGRQKMFLRSTLRKHEHFDWQIPQYHRPIRPHVAHKKEMKTQYKNFLPLFEKYKNVRLCLENDSHTCKITWPIRSSSAPEADEGFVRDDSTGIVYAGEGCWGAPLRTANDHKSWTRNAEAINQFNWIFIDQEKILIRTVKYENVNDVAPLKEATRFEMPEGIDLWSPSNGSLVEIPKR